MEQAGKTLADGSKSRKKTGNKWFETQDQIAYYPEFEKEKIIYPNMTKFLPFVYDQEGFYTNDKCFIITGKAHLKYLAGYLNSAISAKWIRENCPELQGGTKELRKVFFEHIPIPQVTTANQYLVTQIKQRVDQISVVKTGNLVSDVSTLEAEIDRLVYEMYELTPEEISMVARS